MDVSSVLSTGTGATQTADRGLAGISGEDFMNLLIKQLQYQDPFKPMTNEEMAAQIATIRELEVNTRLGTKLEQITDQQRFGSAAALMGKYVAGAAVAGDGTEYDVEGIVTSVRFTSDGKVMLELDTGETLPLSGLEVVTEPGEES